MLLNETPERSRALVLFYSQHSQNDHQYKFLKIKATHLWANCSAHFSVVAWGIQAVSTSEILCLGSQSPRPNETRSPPSKKRCPLRDEGEVSGSRFRALGSLQKLLDDLINMTGRSLSVKSRWLSPPPRMSSQLEWRRYFHFVPWTDFQNSLCGWFQRYV